MKRTLAMPTRDKGESLARKLGRIREHKRKWPTPADAELVLSLHFSVHSFRTGSYNADATLEIPTANGFDYATISFGAKTYHDALLGVIRKIEESFWFHHMKARHVYFKVTGETMEEVYRGYL